MSWFHFTNASAAPATRESGDGERAQSGLHLSDNAQMWRRLARDGYGRTAEQVRASQPAALAQEIKTPKN